jgi:hypothetical protein
MLKSQDESKCLKVDGSRDLKANSKAFELTTWEWPRNLLPFCGLRLKRTRESIQKDGRRLELMFMDT